MHYLYICITIFLQLAILAICIAWWLLSHARPIKFLRGTYIYKTRSYHYHLAKLSTNSFVKAENPRYGFLNDDAPRIIRSAKMGDTMTPRTKLMRPRMYIGTQANEERARVEEKNERAPNKHFNCRARTRAFSVRKSDWARVAALFFFSKRERSWTKLFLIVVPRSIYCIH